MYRVADAQAGKKATCKACGTAMLIPSGPTGDGPVAVPAAAPPAGAKGGGLFSAAPAAPSAPSPPSPSSARRPAPTKASAPARTVQRTSSPRPSARHARAPRPWYQDKPLVIGIAVGAVVLAAGVVVLVMLLRSPSGGGLGDEAALASSSGAPGPATPARTPAPATPPPPGPGAVPPGAPTTPPIQPPASPVQPVLPADIKIDPNAVSSAFDAEFSPAGRLLAVTDRTAGAVALLDVPAGAGAAGARLVNRIPLAGEPAGIAWSGDGRRLFVAELGAGSVAEVDPAAGKVTRRLAVSPRPAALAVANKKNLLLVASPSTNDLAVVDLATGALRSRLAMLKWPGCVAVTDDEALAVVGNRYPAGSSLAETAAAAVSLVDLTSLRRVADIPLPAGSSLVEDLAISPDGRWAYVSHTLGRTNLPTSQLDRGWVNTNAISVIDLPAHKLHTTVLMDRAGDGAANPWGLALSRDGGTLYVALSGIHQIATIDVGGLHRLLDEAPLSPEDVTRYRAGPHSMWQEIRRDPRIRARLTDNLAALWSAGLITRTTLPGNGPRGLSLAPDGKTLAAACYFSGEAVLADAATGKPLTGVKIGSTHPPDLARQGEMIFHDARVCYQNWLSCATCHPEGRADALNWDLLNDGMGNPKNTKSLLWSNKTPPSMATGIRKDMDMASAAGFRFILFRQPEPGQLEAVRAYLKSMAPARSPYRPADGSLTAQAMRGKAIFESNQAGCSSCHPAPLLTDLTLYNVGTKGRLDHRDEFDTPTLVELWRTGPYLHDGSAPTLFDVISTRNQGNRHGRTSTLTPEQMRDLVAYLLSL